MKWTWSYGEQPTRSNRNSDKSALNQLKDENAKSMKQAHEVSLNHDENTWDLMNMMEAQSKSSSNREELNFKVSGRQMMQQIGNNPFLENNYHQDIANHNVFLMPKNSK